MEKPTKKIFFKMFHGNFFDDYGEFTDQDIQFFKDHQETIREALNIIIENTNTRISYLNIPILKQIVYTANKAYMP